MANANIKISQLPNIGGNLDGNTLLPVVSTVGTYLTDKLAVKDLANFILTEAGNSFPEAFVSQYTYAVVNASQPNITSIGNLTGLTVTNLSNLHIPGGTNGYVLQTNGDGNLNWTAMAGSGNGNPGGANTQIQFNDEGLFNGNPGLTFDKTTDTLGTVNFLVSSATVYDGLYAGNVLVNDTLTSENIQTNNLTANNFTSSGNIEANFFIGNGSALTGITATASGAGPNTSIQYNSNGIFAGDANLTFDVANSTLSTVDISASNITLTANVSADNIAATGNIDANIVTATYLVGDGSNITNISASYAENANISNVANSVAVANVVGIGNIATLSLDGNSSNILYGNGVFAGIPATANANYANFAGEAYSVSGANVSGEVANANYALHVDVEGTTNNYSYHVVLVQNPGDNNLQIDGDDQLQYNPDQGLLTTYRLDADIIVANLEYSFGYQASNLVGIGNVAFSNFDGNASNVLSGTGTWINSGGFGATGATGVQGATGATGPAGSSTAIADLVPDNSTLANAVSLINTIGKVAGKLVVVTDTGNRFIYAASGPLPTDTWWSVTGSADITPI